MAKAKPFIFRPWMIGRLRLIFRRYPPYYLALKAVRIEVPNGFFKTGKRKGQPRFRVFYPCAQCGQVFPAKETCIDHKDPVMDPKVGFPLNADGTDDWATYLYRLFCPIENLQVLCLPCHVIKSGKETKVRAKSRKKKKQQLTNV